jgi:lycopene beta-cyclase
VTPTDVLVVGGGPAGWSVASACAERGLRVALVDPRPDRPWHQTFGSWAHELPDDLPPSLVAASGCGTAVAGRAHRLDDRYVVLDTGALHRHLRHPAVTVHAAKVAGPTPGGIALVDGTVLTAGAVVDASGAAQVLSRRRPRHGRPAEQTAAGVVLPDAVAARVTGGRLLFMDWRPRHGRPGWPTFLYAVPLGGGRTLLEETSLVRRPGLPVPELRARLQARLQASGIGAGEIAGVPDEIVRFPVDTPPHLPPPGVVAVGAAAPVTHPATGFSLATSLRLAPRVADALVGRAGAGAVEDARRVVRSPAAALVHAMRHRGLDVLLRMPPGEVPAFFDAFFTLPTRHRRAYLDGREDVGASLAAMLALFSHLPARLRVHLITGSVLGPGGVRMDDFG